MKKNSRDIEFWCFINPIQAKVKGDSRKKKRFKWQLKKKLGVCLAGDKRETFKILGESISWKHLRKLFSRKLITYRQLLYSQYRKLTRVVRFFFLVFVSFTGCQKFWAFHQDAFLSYVHNCIYCTFVDLSNTLSYRKEFH